MDASPQFDPSQAAHHVDDFFDSLERHLGQPSVQGAAKGRCVMLSIHCERCPDLSGVRYLVPFERDTSVRAIRQLLDFRATPTTLFEGAVSDPTREALAREALQGSSVATHQRDCLTKAFLHEFHNVVRLCDAHTEVVNRVVLRHEAIARMRRFADEHFLNSGPVSFVNNARASTAPGSRGGSTAAIAASSGGASATRSAVDRFPPDLWGLIASFAPMDDLLYAYQLAHRQLFDNRDLYIWATLSQRMFPGIDSSCATHRESLVALLRLVSSQKQHPPSLGRFISRACPKAALPWGASTMQMLESDPPVFAQLAAPGTRRSAVHSTDASDFDCSLLRVEAFTVRTLLGPAVVAIVTNRVDPALQDFGFRRGSYVAPPIRKLVHRWVAGIAGPWRDESKAPRRGVTPPGLSLNIVEPMVA